MILFLFFFFLTLTITLLIVAFKKLEQVGWIIMALVFVLITIGFLAYSVDGVKHDTIKYSPITEVKAFPEELKTIYYVNSELEYVTEGAPWVTTESEPLYIKETFSYNHWPTNKPRYYTKELIRSSDVPKQLEQ